MDGRGAAVDPAAARAFSAALAELLRDAPALPDVAGEGAEEDARPHEVWAALYHALQTYFGPHDVYREVFDPYEKDAAEQGPAHASLADGFADLYFDLGDGLALWDAGRLEEAVWEWRFGFFSHWGEHAVGALRALFHLQRAWHHQSLISWHRSD